MKENVIIWLCGSQRQDVVDELEGSFLERGVDVETVDDLPDGTGEIIYFYTGEDSPRETFSRVFKIFFEGEDSADEDSEAVVETDLEVDPAVRRILISLEKLEWIPKVGDEEYSDEEEEEVKKRLEDLGYL